MAADAQKLLHICHARQDEAWVKGVVVPKLGVDDARCWARAVDDVGAPDLGQLQRAVESCRYTLLVASHAAAVDTWVQFEAKLTGHLALEEGKPRLILVTRDFAPGSDEARALLPLWQRCLVAFDCSDPERAESALATIAAQLALATTVETPTDCPYPGLRTFGPGDPAVYFDRPDLFFGREEEARAIVTQLRASRRVLLVGPSGCGKSSLLHARVLPAVRRNEPGIATVATRPGVHPDGALRAALDGIDRRLGPATEAYLDASEPDVARATLIASTVGARGLLDLDQLEEAFVGEGEVHRAESARFFARLAALGHLPEVSILLGMRADFFGELMRSPAWDLVKDHRVELAPLRGEALRLTITGPAEKVGVYVEVDLAERLVREAAMDRAAEALPLLQVALVQLWSHRQWRYLSLASYAQLTDGDRRGLDVVLARHADESLEMLDQPVRELARRVLIDLVHLGEGRPDTRRRRLLAELRRAGDDEAAVAGVVEHLAARRLIVTGAEAAAVERYADLAHDILITGWPALAGWISVHRDQLRNQRRLEARASGGGLLGESELPEFTRWLTWIRTPEGRALGASMPLVELTERSLAAARRRRRVRRGLAGGAVLALVLVSYLTYARKISETKAALAAAQRLHQQGVAAMDQRDGALASAYFAAALRSRDVVETRVALLEARALAPGGYWNETVRGRVMALSPARQLAAVEVGDGSAVGLWDIRERRAVHTFANPTIAISPAAAFTRDGGAFAYGGVGGVVWLADLAGGSERELVDTASRVAAHRLAFDPTGSRLAVGREDGTVTVFDLGTGTQHHFKDQLGIISLAFSPDGALIAAGGSSYALSVWDLGTDQLRWKGAHQDVVQGLAFDPSGERLASGGADGVVLLWATTPSTAVDVDGVATPIQKIPMSQAVRLVAFDSDVDAPTLAIGMEDGTVRLWDFDAERVDLTLHGSGDSLTNLAFSADGVRVFTGGLERALQVWDRRSRGGRILHRSPEGGVQCGAFVPGTHRLVTGTNTGAVREWDADQPAATRLLRTSPAPVSGIAVSSNGWIATAGDTLGDPGSVFLWPAEHPERVRQLPHASDSEAVAFDPTGATMASTGDDGFVRRWQVETGTSLGEFELNGSGWNVLFNPMDATQLATGDGANLTSLWRLDGPGAEETLHAPPESGAVWGISFSPDGALLASGGVARRVHVWRVTGGAPIRTFADHTGTVTSVAFSADGDLIASAGLDSNVYLHRFGSDMVIGLHDHWMPTWWVAISSDGRYLASGGLDGVIAVWDVTALDRLVRHTSARALADDALATTGLAVRGGVITMCERCGNLEW